MILYQLPSGKTIYISVDKLLTLSKTDIQDLETCGAGSVITNPFVKLPTSSKEFKDLETESEDEHVDTTPDMLSDGDDEPFIDVDYDNL